jgi:hypothetical protein
MPKPNDQTSVPGFWRDYLAWLWAHRIVLAVLTGLLLVLFVSALLLSASPEDPFTYDI